MNNWYRKKYIWLQAHPRWTAFIVHACTGLPALVYIVYIGTAGYVLRYAPHAFIGYIGIPASGFCLETWLRFILDWPRPYEVLGIPALKPKNTTGKSFPSRHSFSAAIVSMACFSVHPILGYGMMIVAILIGLCRILIGVHWIKDAVAGCLLGWGLGLLGFYLMPALLLQT